MPTRNISLTEHLDGFVERTIRAGRFANASEVARAGLHLLDLLDREEDRRSPASAAAAAEGIGALDRGGRVLLAGGRALRRKLWEVGRAARAGNAGASG